MTTKKTDYAPATGPILEVNSSGSPVIGSSVPIATSGTNESQSTTEAEEARRQEEINNQQSIPAPLPSSAEDAAEVDTSPDTPPEKELTFFKSKGPHYFTEVNCPVYYHDVIVYIQGADVSQWLEGSVAIKYNTNTDPNTCDLVLNNAANRFVVTPENIQGKWRLAGSSTDNDYDETAKHEIFKFKTNKNYRPDNKSHGALWPISYWSTIFHKNDPIRVWIKNPQPRIPDASGKEADEWLPVFTGYITSYPVETNHINDSSKVSIHAEDIRSLMSVMRVNQNSYMHIPPGSDAGVPTFGNETDTPNNNRLRFDGRSENSHYDSNLFKDLIIRDDNTITQRVWDTAPFFAIVDILTFGSEDPAKLLDRVSDEAAQKLRDDINKKRQELAVATPDAKAKISKELTDLVAQSAYNLNTQSTGGGSGKGLVPTHNENLNSSKLGRMQRGIFRGNGKFGVVYPKDRKLQISFLEGWYALCAFGTPHRNSKDGYLRYNTSGFRYWRKAEVHRAGRRTRYGGSWAPDTQAVHMIEPAVDATSLPFFDNVKLREQSNTIAYTRLFMSRLEMLDKACSLVDYRFWVTGTGDIVFEFPNYDFQPSDYGGWGEVLTFDTHIISENLNEEAGKITTVLVGTNHATGIVGVGEDANSAQLKYTTVNYEIVWAPQLVARLGIVSDTMPFNSIVSKERLTQLTTLAFQRKLGTFASYSMSTLYRPWVQPNRPIYNKYRARYALAESVGFTLPVTAGSRAGNQSPTTEIRLNYVRSIDITGVPRYITGGPSMPVFYGERQGEAGLTAILQRSASNIDSFIEIIESRQNTLTPEGLRLARDQAGVLVSQGQDLFNVLGKFSPNPLDEVFEGKLNIVESPVEALSKTSLEVARYLNELQSGLDNGMTPQQLEKEIAAAKKSLKEVSKAIAAYTVQTIPGDADTNAGVLPLFDYTGIRHVSFSVGGPPPEATPSTPGNTCNVGPYTFSCPLGTTRVALSLNGSVVQEANQFPRSSLTTYNMKDDYFPILEPFAGIDFIAEPGEDVYAAAEGTVSNVIQTEIHGKMIVISHFNGYETTYGAVNPRVSLGDTVGRNQVIGTISSSFRSKQIGTSVLHFMTHTGAGNSISTPTYLVGNIGNKVNPPPDDPENTYYPITEEDIRWVLRASKGETSFDAGSLYIASCFINRYVSSNDASIRREGRAAWGTLTEFVKGNPPHGRGYSQPVSEYWLNPIPMDDGTGRSHPNGNRDDDAIKRRYKIRAIGTSDGDPFDPEQTAIIRDLFSGKTPIIPNISHFLAPSISAEASFRAQNPDAVKLDIAPAGEGNVFFSVQLSVDLSKRGLPKITTTKPDKFARTPYDPTRADNFTNPGVPNLKAILGFGLGFNVDDPKSRQYAQWSKNKVLLVGNFAERDFGKAVKSKLESESLGATVKVLQGLQDSIPGRTGKTTDLVSEANLALLRGVLSNFKPDVTFIMYGAAMIEADKLNSAMVEINQVITKADSDLWWVGPPEYPKGHNLTKYRNIANNEGSKVLGSRYIKSAGIMSTATKASMTAVDGPAAEAWAQYVLANGRSAGKDRDVYVRENETAIGNNFWDGAVPPEKCPPSSQKPKAEPVLQSLLPETTQSVDPGNAPGIIINGSNVGGS